MSIYRPAGYGPAPTREEHDAALKGVSGMSFWLLRSYHVEPWLAHVWIDDRGDLATSAYGVQPEDYILMPSDRVGRLEWCLIHPTTGLPYALGTPPETERERLMRALVEAVNKGRARGGLWLYGLAIIANAGLALADHIIAEGGR